MYYTEYFLLQFSPFVDYEAVVKLSDGFNGADLRNVCTEAGNLSNIFRRPEIPCSFAGKH
jgi:ATP-dependent 26S proteasome regulatory subunit